MAFSSYLLIALVGISLVSCQFDRDFEAERRERERERSWERSELERIRLAEACIGKVMDVFFVLDSSSSIYINDYMTQHSVVGDIIRRFDVSPESTRVGMLTYSDDLERPVIGLRRYNTKNELLAGITLQNLPYRTGVTNTDMAIRYARQITEFRQDITKVLVVLTDGGSRSPGSTAREADLARNAGFYLFVVGIGQYIEGAEWRAIASDPDDSFVYNITNAQLLEDVKLSLPSRACALPPIIIGGSCDVNRPSEIYFVASRSASDRAINIIDNFKRRTRDPRNNLRISYLIEACGSVTNAALSDEDVVCDRFAPRTGDTAESVSALSSRARSIAQESRNDGGRAANQIIVLFADDETMSLGRFGWSNDARSAENFEGVTVVVVNLGLRNYRDFAQRMVTDRNNYISFSGGSLDNQVNQRRQFIDSVCVAANKASDGPDFQGIPT